MFEYEGQEITLQQIEQAAKASNMSVEDYKKRAGIKELGKTTTTSQSAGVDETAALEITDTASKLEDISLELPKAESATSGQTIDSNLNEGNNQPTVFKGVVGGLAKIPFNITKQVQGLRDMVLMPVASYTHPGLSIQERKDLIRNMPTMGMGMAVQSSQDVTDKANKALDGIREYQGKIENESLSKAWEKGNYSESAFLAADGLMQSLPSIGFSILGPAGIAAHGMLISGEKFSEEIEQSPDAELDALYMNAIATGALQAASDAAFRGLGQYAGVINKTGGAMAAKDFLETGFKEYAKKFLLIPGEGLTEVVQELGQTFLDKISLGRDVDYDELQYRLIDNFVIGSLMGGGAVTVSSLASSPKNKRAYAEGLLMPEEIKTRLNNKIDQYNNLNEKIQSETNPLAKKSLEKGIVALENNISSLQAKYKTALYGMSDSQLNQYASNKDEVLKRKKELFKTTTEVGKKSLIEEINELEKLNKQILKDAVTNTFEATNKATDAAFRAMGIDKQTLTADEIGELNIEDASKIAETSDGIIYEDPETKQLKVVLNKDTIKRTKAVNAPAHELLHGLLVSTLKANPAAAINMKNALLETLKTMDTDKVLNSDIKRRLQNYLSEPEAIEAEEVLTLFADATATGDIVFEENIFTKIGDRIRRFLQDLGVIDIKFDTGRDVYNFIKDYNKDIKDGGVREKVLAAAKKGFTGKLIDGTEEVEVEEEFKRFSRSEASEKVQQIYEEQGAAGAMDIIDQFAPIVDKLVNKYRNVPGFEYQLLRDEIETGKRGILDMIMEYTPEKANGAPLAGYINKFLSRRAIEAANRVLDTEFTEDVTEAKKVTSTETAEQTIEAAETAPKQPETSTLAQRLELTDDVKTKVLDAVTKTFGTKLPDTTSDKFRDALIKAYRTELKPVIAKLMGTRANYESFLADNFEAIYEALPQSTINRRFNEFAEPVLDKDGKQLREKTAVGKGIFKKRKIVKAEWLNYFTGRDVAPSKKGTRKTSIAEEIGVEVAFDATLAALSNPDILNKYNDIRNLQGFSPVNNTIDVIGKEIDRANVKFSNSETISAVVSTKLPQFIKELRKVGTQSEKKTIGILKSLYGDNLTEEDRKVLAKYVKSMIGQGGLGDIPEQIFSAENLAKFKGKIGVTGSIFHLGEKFSAIGTLVKDYPDIAQNTLNDITKTLKRFVKTNADAAFVYAIMKDTTSREKSNPIYPLNGTEEYDAWFEKTFGADKLAYAKNNLPDLNIKYGIKVTAMKAALGDREARKTLKERNNTAIKAQELLVALYEGSSAETEVEQVMFSRMLAAAEKGIVRMAAPITTVAIKNKADINKKGELDKKEGGYTYEHRASQVGVRNAFHAYYFLGEKSINLKQVLADFQVIIAPNDIAKEHIDATYLKASDPREHIPGKTSVIELTYHNEMLARRGAPMYDLINTVTGKITKPPATVKSSKSLSRQFNEVLEKSTGVEWYKTYSPAKARLVGKKKGRKFFIPYSADDFVGLLYTTLGKGKVGDQQMAWYEKNLLRPFSRGIQRYEAAKQKSLRDWMTLKKEASKNVPGGLNKVNDTGFTNQNSVRMYIWQKQGMEIPNISKQDLNENLKIVNNNPELKEFAESLIGLNPGGYPEPSNNWDSGDITTDLVSYINDVRRGEFLTEWKENVEQIFSEDNKNKLRALYGDRYVEALNDMLHRMRTGRNRKIGTSKIERTFMDWTNNSVGAIMFFNARSAVLQTLSAVNFINFSDNNPINAGIAFANQKQYWKDFATLFNSDFLKQRRSGLQTDINADEIANAASNSKNKAKAALSAILKFGFTPTQIADSFAIASGGATMYRNRIKKYLKEGLDQETAEKRAFTDFQEIAEETQQSARPDRISMQQASSLGRLILAFGNTPMQYARLTKKATLDLINGRGDWKTNISKIAYYSVIQNIIFSALQQGLFALLFDEEDDDKEKERYFRIGNSSIDTLLRGTGVYGAAAATVKNMIMEIIDQSKKSRPDYTKVAIEATQISPPINSKLRKLESAGKTFTYKQSREKVFTEGFSLENPAFLAAGKVISAGTNLPADRLVQKADHIKTALEPETELWQAIALSLGWSEWDLGMIEKQTSSSKKPGFKRNKKKGKKSFK